MSLLYVVLYSQPLCSAACTEQYTRSASPEFPSSNTIVNSTPRSVTLTSHNRLMVVADLVNLINFSLQPITGLGEGMALQKWQ